MRENWCGKTGEVKDMQYIMVNDYWCFGSRYNREYIYLKDIITPKINIVVNQLNF